MTSPLLAPEGLLVQYLLGRMPEAERVELEARLFREQDLDQELLATIDDLVHAYLAGTLPEADRSQFETHFLASAENRDQLAAMRDVLLAVERVSDEGVPAAEGASPAHAPRSPAWVLAAAAVVTLAVALAAVVAARRMGQGEKRATASPLPAASATPSAEIRPQPTMPSVPATVRMVRLPGTSGSQVNFDLSPSTRTLRLEVPVDHESLSFDAAILAADGKAVWRAEGLAPPALGHALVLEVPAPILALNRYTLRVEGESSRAAVAPVLEYRLHITASPR